MLAKKMLLFRGARVWITPNTEVIEVIDDVGDAKGSRNLGHLA